MSGIKKGQRVRVELEGEVGNAWPGHFRLGRGDDSNVIYENAEHVVSVEVLPDPEPTVRRAAEREQGLKLAGSLAPLLDDTAESLHRCESLHLHDGSGPVGDCGYCYLRAGRTLGVLASHYPLTLLVRDGKPVQS